MIVASPTPTRGAYWKWGICGLLLLATMLNYMDRLTLNLTAVRIMDAFGLDERGYGQLESAFAFAFAIGAIICGWLADRWNIRLLYPVVLLAWSAAGFATGLSLDFFGLLMCRFLLGLAESGNWPAALRTTQHILPPSERTMGNSLLQSGAAVGAILTPLIVMGCLHWTGSWRTPFLVIGVLGVLWVGLWLMSVRRDDLAVPQPRAGSSLVSILGVLVMLLGIDVAVHTLPVPWPWLPLVTKIVVTAAGIGVVFLWLRNATRDDDAVPRGLFVRRLLILMVMVVTLNATWHYLRAWLPLFLQKEHGYTENETFWFSIAYYIFTDAGCLAAGFVTLYLARRGLTVHRSRLAVFAVCAVLTTLSLAVALLPKGPLLIALLLVIGFAAMGLFPNYYSFSQEITVRYQGKLTGALGCVCWLSMSLLHELVGDSIKSTGSYTQAMSVAGFLPLIGLGAIVLFWGKHHDTGKKEAVEEVKPEPEPARA